MKKKEITLKDIKKNCDVWNDHPVNIRIFGYVSPYVSYFFTKFLPFITPNQITFAWGIIGLIGILIMTIGSYWYLLLGILIYHFAIFLDYLDGEIARATGKTTLGGPYLDNLFSSVNRGLLVLALGVGVYRVSGSIIYLYLGIVSGLFLIFDNLNKLKLYEALEEKKRLDLLKQVTGEYRIKGYKSSKKSFIQKMKSYCIEMLRPANPFSLLFFAIVFNVPGYYLILMTIVSFIAFVRNFLIIYNKIGNVST